AQACIGSRSHRNGHRVQIRSGDAAVVQGISDQEDEIFCVGTWSGQVQVYGNMATLEERHSTDVCSRFNRDQVHAVRIDPGCTVRTSIVFSASVESWSRAQRAWDIETACI